MSNQGRKKSLSFSLKPMKPISTPSGEPQKPKRHLSFEMDFSCLNQARYQIPQNIDQFWQQIGCRESFTSVLTSIQTGLPDQVFNDLFTASSTRSNSCPFLRSFGDIASHMKLILPPLNLITFVSHPVLDMNNLFQLISDNSKVLFISSIRLIAALLKGRDYKTQNHIIHEFAKLLVPPQESFFEAQHIEHPVRMFAPLFSNTRSERFWGVLKSDLSIGIYKNVAGTPLELELPPNSYQFNLTQGVLTYQDQSFMFMTQLGPDIFDAALKGPSSMDHFIQSFKGIERYVINNSLPVIVREQFIAALSAPDFVLATAVVQSLVDTTDRITSVHVLTALNESGTFAPFIRQAFMEDVKAIDNPSKLYRTSTIATCIASSIMGNFGAELIPQITNVLRHNVNSPKVALREVIKLGEKLPILTNFVFSAVFKATRRKFPENLLPVVTVGSIFTLRYLLPQLMSVPELKDIGNHLAKGFLLRREDQAVNDEPLMRETCQFLVDLTYLNGSAFPFEPYDFAKICQFLSNSNDKIIAQMSKGAPVDCDPPLTWSLVEMIENCFVGCEHDFRAEILAADLFDPEDANIRDQRADSICASAGIC